MANTMQAPGAARHSVYALLTAVVFACGLAAVFFVPYRFPHDDPSSMSHAVHFSNKAAQVILVLFTAAFGLGTRGLGLAPAEPMTAAARGSRLPLLLMELVAAASAATVWIWARSLGIFGETFYFLDRYSDVALGKRLYYDMEFSYGPLLFYPQYWLARAFHLSFGDAHFTGVLVDWVAGIALLWYLCTRLASVRRHAVVLFVLLSGTWLATIVSGGINFTPYRFTLAPALALAVYGIWRRGGSLVTLTLAAVAAFWLLLFTSPEQGIAFAGATILFFGACVRRRRLLLPLAGFLAGCALAMLTAVQIGIFHTLVTSGSGVLDFPILPSLVNVLLLGGFILSGCVVVAAFRAGKADHPALYLIALSLGTLPAALGRCDTGHVFINMLPALAAVFVTVAARRGLAWPAIPLTIFMLSLLHQVTWHHGIDIFQRQLRRTTVADRSGREATRRFLFGLLHAVHAPASLRQNITQRIAPDPIPPPRPQIAPGTHLLAPFGFERDFHAVEPLPVDTGFYTSFFPLASVATIDLRIDDLKRQPRLPLLIPLSFARGCPNVDSALPESIPQVTYRPWYVPPIVASSVVPTAYCNYVYTHYHPTDLTLGESQQQIWMPNPPQP